MIDRNHPAVEAAARSAYESAWGGEHEPWSEVGDLERDEWRAGEAHSLTAALPRLTADYLRHTPGGRELMAQTLRAAGRAAVSVEEGVPWDHDWDRATVAAWLDEIADDLEREADA